MRVPARVNVTMTVGQVADVLGLDPEDIVSFKNGVAVVADPPTSLPPLEEDEPEEEVEDSEEE